MYKTYAKIRSFLFLLIIIFITPHLSAQEEDEDSALYRQYNWFFSQRSAPYDTVPRYEYTNALDEKASMSPGGYILQTTWVNIGPAPSWFQGNWVNGRVTAIRYAGDDKVFIGAGQGGVWEGVNPATNIQWYDRSQNLTSLSSGAIAIDINPNDADDYIIYYGSGESVYGTIYTYSGQGVFKSTDHGSTWQQYSFNSDGPLRIFRLVIRPGDGNRNQILAATSGGLYRSTNAGVNWTLVSVTADKFCTDVVFANSDIAYITGPSTGVGYMKSSDGGINFSNVSNSNFEPSGRTHISVCAMDIDIIYAVTDLGNDYIKPYRSINGGINFTAGSEIHESSQMGFCLFIYAKPDDPDVAYIGAVHLYRTTNSGTNYTLSSNPYVHDDMHDLAFNPENADEIIVASDGGVYLSTNAGDNWSSLNNNQLSVIQAYRISANGSGINGGFQDNSIQYLSGGSTWSALFGGFDGTAVTSSKNADILCGIFGNNGDIRRWVDHSINQSTLWYSENIGYWDPMGFDWVGALTAHPVNTGEFYTARRDIDNHSTINLKKVTNGGSNWSNIGSFTSPVPPQNIEFSKTDPLIVYLGTSGFYGSTPSFGREIWKSVDGGQNWNNLHVENTGIPLRYITSIVTTPSPTENYEDEVYITLSGFYQGSNEGHVFKSINGGSNWSDESGNLPDIPVNDIAIYYSGCNSKTLVAATDYGVFGSTDGGTTWKELASGCPKTVVTDLEYLPVENRLLASTFGRGIYKVDLGPSFVITEVELQGNVSLIEDLTICSGGKLKMSNGQSITMAAGKKIIIEDGGELELTNGTVTFGNINGWGGIEINDNAVWDVSSCSINSTSTPITIQGGDGGYDNISLSNITFDNVGPVQIINRPNVTVTGCSFIQGAGLQNYPEVCAVVSSGSDDIDIYGNEVHDVSTLYCQHCIIPSTAISINYGSNVSIRNNTITNISDGIMVSNSSPYIYNNEITTTVNLVAYAGISLDNSYSAVVNENIVNGCNYGVKLYNSSPTMLKNVISVSDTGLYANYNSSPRIRPDYAPGQVIWDAGQNDIQTSDIGIYLFDYSLPDVDYGFNTINGTNYYITGAYYGNNYGSAFDYYVRCNDWVDDPVNGSKFALDLNVIYQSNDCGGPGGGGFAGNENETVNKELPDDPPQPLVVGYGNGVYDTLETSSQSRELAADQQLYLQGMEQELLSNFNSAFTIYQQVILNYRDSASAISSLKRLIRCKDRMNADTSAYSQLRAYYQSLVSNNPNDTAFVQVAGELASKCLVRMGQHPGAITEYENVVSTSSDTLEVLNAELNIIGIYMLMSQHGNAPSFTGKYSRLKPRNVMDGFRMIKEKLHKKSSKVSNNIIPRQFKLSQNYPNPFNPLTKIKYDLPKDSKVTLVIYDILGREVKRLVNNETKAAGSYIVEFNGLNYASGVYFYRIEAGDFVQSKKMVLVK